MEVDIGKVEGGEHIQGHVMLPESGYRSIGFGYLILL